MKKTEVQWLPVPFSGFCKDYEVSTTGIVRRTDDKTERRHFLHKNGYINVVLMHKGESLNISVHRLVALAFILNPHPDLYNQVGHKNDVKTDNRVENLYWTNAQENNCHGSRIAKQAETWRKKRESNRKKGGRTPVYKLVPTSWSGVTAVWYCSIAQASRDNGIPPVDIRAACRGIRATAGGYRWVFAYGQDELKALPPISS